MDRFTIETVISDTSSESYEEEHIFFTKDTPEESAIINFENYQIAPIKTNNYELEITTKLKFIDKIFLFDEKKPYYLSILITIISILIGTLASLPLAGYQGDIQLLTLFDLITCIIKAICGGLIFIGCWFDYINGIINNIYVYMYTKEYNQTDKQIYQDLFKSHDNLDYIKNIVIIFFASLYALPYTWEYWISPNTLIKTISVPFYFLSLLLVFYNRTIEQFEISANTFTIGRRKKVLLDSIDRVIKNSKEDTHVANKIIEKINEDNDNNIKLSTIFAINDKYIFYNQHKEELTQLYEDDNYDRFKSTRKTVLNLSLGVIYVSLLITLIYQYQNLLDDILTINGTNIIKNPDTILWIAIWTSIIEAALFILATYNIHYNYITKLLKIENCIILKNKITKLLIYSPMISAGVILAITRLQSSYIAYAILASLLQLNKNMGFFLIGIGMVLSFSVEMNFMIKTCIHIINTTLRNILTSKFVPNFLFTINYVNRRKNLSLVIIYSKKMKKIINSLNDDGINFLMNKILHR